MTTLGADTDGDGLGDTDTPYTGGGSIAAPGDPHPLVGDPDIETFDNPQSLCARRWDDWGRNERTDGSSFDTANGAQFATDGDAVFLLEGTNGTRFDRLDRTSRRYAPRADLPEAVWDGGALEWVGTGYLASPGIQFDPATGAGKGPKLYAYDVDVDAWTPRASAHVDAAAIAIEDLAWDPVGDRVYATIVAVADGGLGTARRRLGIYDPAADAWVGVTQKATVEFAAGSEVACLDGRVYAWPGGFGGGAVTGADSFLHVYDIASDTWTTTATLQDSAVIPGFRSGAFDLWGVALAIDPEARRVFVLGGEANHEIPVFDVGTGTWTATPRAPYDGGWGDALVYAWSVRELIQLDGRAAGGTPQGTAVLGPPTGDIDGDGLVGVGDLLEVLSSWGPCDTCCPADVDEDGAVGVGDLLAVLAAWS